MKKIMLLIFIGFLLGGCIRPHRIDIEQGNIIKTSTVRSLHPGMTDADVRNVMGNPLIVNIFSPNRMDYVYTFQSGYNKMKEERVICLFKRNILQEVITER